ncbi:MAG: CoA transferase [Thermoplasmata archaeon]|nr:CoA transferase [Thermoplasmata archaeon]
MNLVGYRSIPDLGVVSIPRKGALIPPYGPLEGVRVVDSGRYVAGPWAATYLGEFGAQVIHVEGPPFGPPYADPTRSLPPLLPEGSTASDGVSESWVQYSRNKLSLGLDVRTEEGKAVFLDLLGHADIWVESSRPGTFDRFGLSDESVWAVNPKVTIVHVSGFGQTGTPGRVHAPSYDLIGQAFSGYLSLQGEPDPAPPTRSGTALNDTVTGLASAAAALMGYIHAQRTGKGQAVDVAQYEVFFTMMENLALDFFMRGVVRGRHGRAHARLHPYDLYRATDGWVVVAAPTQESWGRLKALLNLTDPVWDDRTWRLGHRPEVDAAISAFCASRSRAALEEAGAAADVAIAAVRDIADLSRDAHYQARGMFVEWEDPVAGPVKGAGVAPRFSDTPGRVWRGAPWLGQDNRTILVGLLGYHEARLAELTSHRTIGESPPSPRSGHPSPFFRRGSP